MKKIILFLAAGMLAGFAYTQTDWASIGWAASSKIVAGERLIRVNMGPAGYYYLTDTIKKYGGTSQVQNSLSPNSISLSPSVTATNAGLALKANLAGTNIYTAGNADYKGGGVRIFDFASTNVLVNLNKIGGSGYEAGGLMLYNRGSINGNVTIQPDENNNGGFTQKLQGKNGSIALVADISDALASYSAPSQIDNTMTSSSTRGASRDAIISYFTSSLAAFVPPSQIDNNLTASTTRGASRTAINDALALKANDAEAVKLTGAQSIAGLKTFTNGAYLNALRLTTLTGSPGGFLAIDANGDISKATATGNGSVLVKQQDPQLTGTPTAPTATQTTNSTQIATTAYVRSQILGVSATLDFPSTAINQNSKLTVTVTGAAVGDVVAVNWPVSLAPPTTWNGVLQAYVSSANTVSVIFMNMDPMAVHDLASASYGIRVFK